mmetsp:Transcript_42937/g.129693  ORF Transcript_42937/g.129693 Transcript_42937/m.129693 type:complete len:247 (+) Transcript_42937:1336-2076(+)
MQLHARGLALHAHGCLIQRPLALCPTAVAARGTSAASTPDLAGGRASSTDAAVLAERRLRRLREALDERAHLANGRADSVRSCIPDDIEGTAAGCRRGCHAPPSAIGRVKHAVVMAATHLRVRLRISLAVGVCRAPLSERHSASADTAFTLAGLAEIVVGDGNAVPKDVRKVVAPEPWHLDSVWHLGPARAAAKGRRGNASDTSHLARAALALVVFVAGLAVTVLQAAVAADPVVRCTRGVAPREG